MRTPIWIHYKFSDERIVYKIDADENGNLYVPTSGRNHSASAGATYDWNISVDWDTPVNYSWTWSDWGAITLSWYTAWSNHTIIITPTTEAYWRALAYWRQNTTCAPLLTEIFYDGSYKGYASSETSTGNFFRAHQYYWCTSLTAAAKEVLPSTVTSTWANFRQNQYRWCSSLTVAADEILRNWTVAGGNFRYGQYYWCTSLTNAPVEVLPSAITAVGNYFRAYQYYWCTALLNAPDEIIYSWVTSIWQFYRGYQYQNCTSLTKAPDEVLPNTVATIDNYFRYYQYYWCSSLTKAPDEALPSSVTSIGSSFRYYQYGGCSSLTSARLIASNVPNTTNKRWWQFTGAWNTTNPMVITIYWNEMEADMSTNSCWLANNRVAAIYVQPNLVEQYQQAAIRSNIDDVKFWPIEEIIYKMNADDNGNLYVPVGGQSWGPNATYNWNVAVDWDNATNYSWTWSSWWSITLGWYTPWTNHTIKIIPTNIAYWWARAYWWYNTVWAPYLTEVFYDWSYVGYGSSATSTGNYFRRHQYNWCSSLTNAPDEVLPSVVTAIGTYFRTCQYYWCTSLITAPDEVLPSWITSIGTSFRNQQYYWCTSLVNAPSNEVFSSAITDIGDYFRSWQYAYCSSLTSAPDEAFSASVATIGSTFRYCQYYHCEALINAPKEAFSDTIISTGGTFRANQFSYCYSLISAKLIANNTVSTTSKRAQQFSSAWNRTNPMTITISWNDVELDMGSNSCDLLNNNVATIYVPSALVQWYQDAAIWSNITDSKFVWY